MEYTYCFDFLGKSRKVAQESCQDKLKPVFWIYSLFAFFCTLGFLNFSTIGYHTAIIGLSFVAELIAMVLFFKMKQLVKYNEDK